MGDMADYYDDRMDDMEMGSDSDVQCRFCHSFGFHWKQLPNGSWRLHSNTTNKLHTCQQHPSFKRAIKK